MRLALHAYVGGNVFGTGTIYVLPFIVVQNVKIVIFSTHLCFPLCFVFRQSTSLFSEEPNLSRASKKHNAKMHFVFLC